MPDLKCIEGGLSGQEPGHRLIINQIGNQRIHPLFEFLEREKAAIVAHICPKTGRRSVSIGSWNDEGGEDAERR